MEFQDLYNALKLLAYFSTKKNKLDNKVQFKDAITMWSSEMRAEFLVWISLVWPVLITNVSQTGMGLTDISFLGHYDRAGAIDNTTDVSKSTTYVSAASLGNIYNSLMNVLIVKGINSADKF